MDEKEQPLFYSFNEVQNMLHQENFPVLTAAHRHKFPNLPLHSHDFTEVVIVNSGRGRHIFDDKEFPIAAGDIFIIPKGVKHGYVNEDSLLITNMVFQMSSVDEHFPEIKSMPGFFAFLMAESSGDVLKNNPGTLLNLSKEELLHVETIQAGIRKEQLAHQAGSKSMCLIYLAELLIYLSRLIEHRPEAEIPSDSYSALAKVYSYINGHYKDKISIEILAQTARMSERNFQRLFTKTYSMSPMSYLMKIRLEKSRDLLRSTSWEISKVAAESGFQENSYFSLQFKKAFKVSPRQYRTVLKRKKWF